MPLQRLLGLRIHLIQIEAGWINCKKKDTTTKIKKSWTYKTKIIFKRKELCFIPFVFISCPWQKQNPRKFPFLYVKNLFSKITVSLSIPPPRIQFSNSRFLRLQFSNQPPCVAVRFSNPPFPRTLSSNAILKLQSLTLAFHSHSKTFID
jgi:hypothetical protein